MSIAYFTNQYPKVSHTFIRREIVALEELGVGIERFALRGSADDVVDEADKREFSLTRYVQKAKPFEIVSSLFLGMMLRPWRFFRTFGFALSLGANSERGVLRHIAYFIEASLLRDWLIGRKISHVHAHFGTNSACIVMLSQLLGGPSYSFTVHGPDEFDKAQFISLREKIRHARFVVAISSFGRSQLYRWADIDDWSKVHIVRCGVAAGYSADREPALADAPRLLCVGRLCAQKGQLLLVQATRLLVDRGIDVKLILAGDGPLRAELESQIRRHGLERHIEITGWIDEMRVRDELSRARAMVLPSFAEGLPVVIMEAFALACPVISTYVAGIPELVEDGINGWLIPAGDVDRLVQAMSEALTASPQQLRRMGENGRDRVMDRHCTSVEAEKLVQLFVNSHEK